MILYSTISDARDLRTPQSETLPGVLICEHRGKGVAELLARSSSDTGENEGLIRKSGCRFDPQSRVFIWASVKFAINLPTYGYVGSPGNFVDINEKIKCKHVLQLTTG